MGFWDTLFKKGTNHSSDKQQNNTAKEATIKVLPFKEEFAYEITEEPVKDALNSSYSMSGVLVDDEQDNIKITYNGILARNGANEVYTVIGYGNNLKWENVEYYPMKNIGSNIFEITVPKNNAGNINIAFKDNADNWDNNSGMNYSFQS